MLRAYEAWDTSPLVLPRPTRLYSLTPIGVGTPMVESLTGYVMRLAEAQCVSAGLLYWKEIRRLAGKGNIFTFRVTNVNGLSVGSRDCPWSDFNNNRKFDEGEITGTCPSFGGGAFTDYAPGVEWPYSDELTAGIETQLPGAVRMGTMFYYRTNRKQIGQVNNAQPSTEYTKFTVSIPNGPGGTIASPKVTTADVYNISVAANAATAVLYEISRQRSLKARA